MPARFLLYVLLILVSVNSYAFFKLPLFGKPEKTVIVLVEGELRYKNMWGHVKRSPIVAVQIRRPKDRISVKVSAKNGLAVFSNLKPGKYVLDEIYAKPDNQEISFTPLDDQRKEYALELKVGEIGYMGKLFIEGELSFKNIGAKFEFQRSKALEIEAIKKTKKRYKRSKWESRFNARIAELSK